MKCEGREGRRLQLKRNKTQNTYGQDLDSAPNMSQPQLESYGINTGRSALAFLHHKTTRTTKVPSRRTLRLQSVLQVVMTSEPNHNSLEYALKHPLQRLKSPSPTLSLILHVTGVFSFAKSFEYLHKHPNPINQSYGWHFQYLTILGIYPVCNNANYTQVYLQQRSHLGQQYLPI